MEPNSALAEKEICTICRAPFQDKDVCSLLGCKHIYHENCIQDWFVISQSCPLCRRKVVQHKSFFLKLKEYTLQSIVYVIPPAVILDDYINRMYVVLSVNRIQDIRKFCEFSDVESFLTFINKYMNQQIEDPSSYCKQANDFASDYSQLQKFSPFFIFSLVLTGFVAFKFFNAEDVECDFTKVEWPPKQNNYP